MIKAYQYLLERGIFWFDFIDILIIAILIYILIYHIRGTRAVHIFIGILFLYVIYILSDFFMLSATHKLLEKTFFYIPFIVIVLFQPTMRNILSSVGGIFIGRKALREKTEKMFSETVRAVFNLASNRFGAIIVFERKQGLKNYAETGCPLGGALLTADLLLTIFYPKTPLHDGAVIVSNGTILAAGAFLPLSSLPLPTLYGTRHRAALGISEETDAIAIVVSEERGEVSLAVNGTIKKMESEEELEKELKRLLLGTIQ